jgi:hypothetical protein
MSRVMVENRKVPKLGEKKNVASWANYIKTATTFKVPSTIHKEIRPRVSRRSNSFWKGKIKGYWLPVSLLMQPSCLLNSLRSILNRQTHPSRTLGRMHCHSTTPLYSLHSFGCCFQLVLTVPNEFISQQILQRYAKLFCHHILTVHSTPSKRAASGHGQSHYPPNPPPNAWVWNLVSDIKGGT